MNAHEHPPLYHLDKRAVRRAFDQAAARYDQADMLQREVGARMLERLDLIRLTPQTVLDVGAGTGMGTEALTQRYKKAQVIALDLAPNMLCAARARVGAFARLWSRRRYVCGDAEHLPLADASVDIIYSNLTLQWCNDLDLVLREFQRVLRPRGALLFSTFGPDTLKELRASWATVDNHTHVNAFLDMHDIGDALVRARLVDPVMDVERITVTYGEVRELMHDLKAIGANNVTIGRAHGLTGAGRIKALANAYEHYRRDGLLPATYEVVYGHAWGNATRSQFRDADGSVKVSLRTLRRHE